MPGTPLSTPEKSRGKSQGQLGMQVFKHLTVHWLCMASPWRGGKTRNPQLLSDPYKLLQWLLLFPWLLHWTHQVLLGKTGCFVARTRFLDWSEVTKKNLSLPIICSCQCGIKSGTGESVDGVVIQTPCSSLKKERRGTWLIAVSASSYIEWPWSRNTDLCGVGWGLQCQQWQCKRQGLVYTWKTIYLLEKHKGWQERVWVHLLIMA